MATDGENSGNGRMANLIGIYTYIILWVSGKGGFKRTRARTPTAHPVRDKEMVVILL